MAKLIKAKIDVKKIQKELLFTGKKGVYLDLSIWMNDKPDEYGNDVSIEQTAKDYEGEKIYIGNGKVKWASDKTALDHASETAASKNDDGLPF